MKSNSKLFGACLTSLGALALLIAGFAYRRTQENKKHVDKKLIKEAVRTWENEGGNVIEPAVSRR